MKVLVFVIAIYLFICSVVAVFPSASSNQPVTATIPVSGVYDGGMKRFYGSGALGSDNQGESQPPIFKLSSGATLKNVILGAPAADGVHCDGSCTLQNVWWEDVGEDAATFRGEGANSLINGGGARKASDKVFQHNGGGTLTIKNFEVSDFGKLYRSCGNCGTQYKRTLNLENIVVTAPGKSIVGINTNYGDVATFKNVYIVGDSSKKIKVCEKFTGNNKGDEPKSLGDGADGTNCKYASSDIIYTSSPPSIGTATSSTTKSATTTSTSTTKSSTTTTTTTGSSSTTGSSTTRKFYTIKNVNSNRCIDVKDASTADGGDIVQYSCSSSRETQIWELKPAGDADYYYLVNYKTGKYADVENCGTGDDVNVRQWSGLNNDCQQFLFDNAANGIWRFLNKKSGKALTVKDCSTSNNGDIRQFTNTNTDCQKWIMTRVLNK